MAHTTQYQIKQPNHKVGKRPKQTFLQRRHTDGKEAYEKMLKSVNYQRNANQNYNEIPSHISQNGHHFKNLQTVNAGESVEKTEHSCTACGNVN